MEINRNNLIINRIISKREGISYLIKTADIICIKKAATKTICIDKNGVEHPIKQPLSRLYSRLDKQLFFKTSRAFLLNLNYMEKFFVDSENHIRVILKKNNSINQHIIRGPNTIKFKQWLKKNY